MVVDFASQYGVALIKSTDFVNWAVIESFVPQKNPFYCGVASLQTIINADRIERNGFITCDQIFTDEVKKIKIRRQVTGECEHTDNPGIELEEYYEISKKLFPEVSFLPASALTNNQLAADLSVNFEEYYWIINFYGPVLDIKAKGHYAALGAWHPDKEHILLLDPARHQDGWFWVAWIQSSNQ